MNDSNFELETRVNRIPREIAMNIDNSKATSRRGWKRRIFQKLQTTLEDKVYRFP